MRECVIALTISGALNLYLRMLTDVLGGLFIVDILVAFRAVESQLVNCPTFKAGQVNTNHRRMPTAARAFITSSLFP